MRRNRRKVRRPVPIALLAVLLTAAGLAPACSSDQLGDGDDWRVGPDAGSDVGPDSGADAGPDGGSDAGRDGGGREREPATFRLENSSSSPVWVKPPNPCRGGAPGWVELDDGGALDDSCRTCDCDRLESGRTCEQCQPCPAAQTLKKVDPGESVAWQWSGRVYRDATVDGRGCERRTIPSAGTQMEVNMCWQTDLPGGSRKCETVEFSYGDKSVTHVVGGEPEPLETTFELTNGSPWPLRITPVSSCSRVDKPWVSLREGGERVDFSGDCSICACEDVQDGSCTVCKRRCPPPTTRELDSGNAETLTWNGVGRRFDSVGGMRCHKRWTPPPGTKMTAVFCFDPKGPDQSVSKTCKRVEFRYGRDTEVSFTFPEGS